MKSPRDLSGRKFADALCKTWSYREIGQTGSHIILQTEQPGHQRIPIPVHKALRIGTLNAILRLVANHKGVSRQQILDTIK
jgi:predicted RNA binding protein YcfA (HicA-like mRNA interferase family)